MIITIETVIRIERADGTSTQVTHESSYPAGDNLRYERSEVTAAADKHHAEVLVRLPIPPDCPEPVYEVPSCSSERLGEQCRLKLGHPGEHLSAQLAWHGDSELPCNASLKSYLCGRVAKHTGPHIGSNGSGGLYTWNPDLRG